MRPRWCNLEIVAAYVYILRCSDEKLYVGSTSDLSRRLAEHNQGLSGWTSSRLPASLIYFEECQTPAQARQRERSLKNGRTRRKTIERMIQDFPKVELARFA